MKKEMKIVLPFYKIAYAVSFVVILSLIRGVVFTNEIGLSIEAPFAILTAVFCADTYVQEITSKRSEIHRLYPIRKRICSIMQRIMIQEVFLLLLAVLGYGLFCSNHFLLGNIGQYIVYAFSQYVDGDWKLSFDMGSNKFHGRR